ncbi:hypothetical protein [Pseudomonas sp. LB3P25]
MAIWIGVGLDGEHKMLPDIEMNKSLKDVLKKIYDANFMTATEVVHLVENRTGDHRDFYPLAALVEANYLGFTGGQPTDEDQFRNSLLAQTFQCYRQGRGRQSYKNVTVFDREERDEVYFYIGPKAVEFFETRRSDTKKLWVSAGLSFFAAVTVAIITYWLRNAGGA